MGHQKRLRNEMGGKHSRAQSCNLVRLERKTEKHVDEFKRVTCVSAWKEASQTGGRVR